MGGNKKRTFKSQEKHDRITLVLPIMGLDLGAISSGNSAVLRFGARRIKPSFSSYYLTLSKSPAAVPADGILFPHHRQYLLVSGNFMTT